MASSRFLFVGDLHSGEAGLPVLAKRPKVRGFSEKNVSDILKKIAMSKEMGTDEQRAKADNVLTLLRLASQSNVQYLVSASLGYTTDDSLLPGGLMRSLVERHPLQPPKGPRLINSKRGGLFDESGIVETKRFFAGRSVLRVALVFADSAQAALAPIVAQRLAEKVGEHKGFAGGFSTPLEEVAIQQDTLMFELLSPQGNRPLTRLEACDAISEFSDVLRGAVVAWPVTTSDTLQP